MAMTLACRAGDPGSIPGVGVFGSSIFYKYYFLTIFMKRDVHHKLKSFDKWESLTSKKGYVEDGLTRKNSEHLLKYINYLKERGREKRTLYENKNKIKAIMRLFENEGFNDITKLKEKDVLNFFTKWREEGHSDDYRKRFKAFWNYWMKINRREGIMIQDIIQDLEVKQSKSIFVWITKEDLNLICEKLDYDFEVLTRFLFDSLARFPSEALSLKVENIKQNSKGEVWVNIPDEISKTFGRKFNLVYCGDMILKYIHKRELKEEDYLFENISAVYYNRKLQEISRKIWGDKKNEAGEYYKKLTGYDFRHSGAIHFRQLFQKTGQSLDSLRHRGGWSDFKIINYYTKLLGLDGHINKEKTLLQEDKTKLEKDLEEQKSKTRKQDQEIKKLKQSVTELLALGYVDRAKEYVKESEKAIKKKLSRKRN